MYVSGDGGRKAPGWRLAGLFAAGRGGVDFKIIVSLSSTGFDSLQSVWITLFCSIIYAKQGFILNLESQDSVSQDFSAGRPASWKPPSPLSSCKASLLCVPQFLVLAFMITPCTGCSSLLAGPAFNECTTVPGRTINIY